MKNINSHKGFTLIELMIVVAIIGILSLMALPVYANYMVRIRYTELITLMLHVDKMIDLESAGGSRDEMALYTADALCMPGTITDSSQQDFKCDTKFLPSTNAIPVKPETSKMTAYKKLGAKDKGYFYSTSLTFKGSNEYIIMSGTHNADGSRYLMLSISGNSFKKLYGGDGLDNSKDKMNVQLFLYRGNVTVKGQKKSAPDSQKWYCAFDSIKSNTLPLQAALPTICKYSLYTTKI